MIDHCNYMFFEDAKDLKIVSTNVFTEIFNDVKHSKSSEVKHIITFIFVINIDTVFKKTLKCMLLLHHTSQLWFSCSLSAKKMIAVWLFMIKSQSWFIIKTLKASSFATQ